MAAEAWLPPVTGFPGTGADSTSDRWSGAELPDDRIRALAIGAYYGRDRDSYNDTVAFLPELDGATETRREQAIERLHASWGVDDAAGARDTVGRLLAGLHAPLFTLVHPLAAAAAGSEVRVDHSGPDHREFLRTLSKFRGDDGGLDHDYDAWRQAIEFGIVDLLPRPLHTDATAWDLARAVFVVRAAHTAGYLDEDESWTFLEAGLAQAQQHYRNWRQFAAGFLTGAVFRAATRDLATVREQVMRRRKVVLGLQLRPSSPWRRVALHPGAPVYGISARHQF
ncbi:DUF1266 domain-containing protein [Nocardia stercoris]|uniref:DUF1266 domain-containing protein n=1 Tax=Nocardia stercoris TaxID=2483361 RepID=UPI00131A1B86|nr:DUF1266 domain-containing protein [Nocardia stercoris]